MKHLSCFKQFSVTFSERVSSRSPGLANSRSTVAAPVASTIATGFETFMQMAKLSIASMALLPSLAIANTGPTCIASLNKEVAKPEFENELWYNKTYMSDFIAADKAFGSRMRTESAKVWMELRSEAIKEMALTGLDDFSYAPHKPILERIQKDAELRLQRRFGEIYKNELEAIINKSRELLATFPNGNPPYKATHRFIMYEVLPVYDAINGERYPELKDNDFHKRHADAKFEGYLKQAPVLFMSYSFLLWNDNFFVWSRPAPHRMLGLNLKGLDDREGNYAFADNFPMKTSEFTWHDAGHVEFEAMRDVEYITNAGKDLERIVFEWEFTKNRIRTVVDHVRETNPDLADSMERILMEVVHERGFNFSLSVLKQELETQKWIEVIERKRAAGFYSHFPTNQKAFELLNEAKGALLTVIKRFKEEDQNAWIYSTLRAWFVPAKITHTPQLNYAKGNLNHIEITGKEEITVFVESKDGTKLTTPIREFVSAQVTPTKDSPFSKTVVKTIERLLWLRSQNKKILWDSKELGISAIVIAADKTVSVKFTDDQFVPIKKIKLPKQSKRIKFEHLQQFEILQVLGSHERNDDLAFTIRPPITTYKGTISTKQDMITATHKAQIQTLDGETIELPLDELRVDPL